MRLFKKRFLYELQKHPSAECMVNHWINDENMSFHDAIVRFAKYLDKPIEYVDPENPEKLLPHEYGDWILAELLRDEEKKS